MKSVAILNHKGGVGKTTLCGSIAQALALSGFKVLTIDNDSQHNLSTMLGVGVCQPTIREVYCADPHLAPEVFLKAIRRTEIPDLHIVTSSSHLSVAEVRDRFVLRDCMAACRLERFYDYILIDNAPGLDLMQAAALYAAHEVFVPTELRQFALNGIAELEQVLRERFPGSPTITRIVPTFYRNTKRQNSFYQALTQMFPGRVTRTMVPLDPVFDELVTEGKVLFLHRLSSKGAAYCVKLMHELFGLDEEQVWNTMIEKRNQRLADEARQRFMDRGGRIGAFTAVEPKEST